MKRISGLLLHPTSLPGGHGVGDLGAEARVFLDWLVSAGHRTWQVLPLVPLGAGNSPYSSWSAFAGNPLLIDLRGLAADGLLPLEALEGAPHNSDRVDFEAVRRFKAPRLRQAAEALLAADPERVARFRAAQSSWVEDAALFEVIWQQEALRPWWEWPEGLRDRQPEALDSAREQLRKALDISVAIQCLFEGQWAALKGECADRGVTLIGDLPIYVDANSADVWAHRELFALDAQGRRTEVAGVPPDGFSATGQLWGNPLYRWDRLEQTGYQWWIARLGRIFDQVDRVRIDHFRAFSAYWAVPADAPDAQGGRWIEGPGAPFFEAIQRALGPLPILAEDLGVIDQGVLDLLDATGFPGMRVLQFAFGGAADNFYLPHNHPVNSVVYTGTHDNNTTLGWWLDASEAEQDHVRRYFGVSGHDLVWDLIRAALASVAQTAILPAQDVLALDGGGRMNTPATAEGNWGWRLADGQLSADHAARLRSLNRLYDRD